MCCLKIEPNLTFVCTSFLLFYIFTLADYVIDDEFNDRYAQQGKDKFMSEDQINKIWKEQYVSESDEESNNLVNDFDTNQDTQFNYEDFFDLSKNVEYSDNLKNIFFKLDKKNNGFISVSQFRDMLSEKGADDTTIEKIFNTKGISKNENNTIKYKEFKKFFH